MRSIPQTFRRTARVLLVAGSAVGLLIAERCFCSEYEERELFRDDVAGFEVAYPKTWEPNPLVEGKRLALRNSDSKDLGVISVTVAKANSDLADREKFLEQFKNEVPDALLASLKSRFGDGQLIRVDETVLSGQKAVLIVLSYDVQQPTGSVSIVSAQLHCLKDGKIYTLNFESPATSFDQNWTTFEKVMSTFNFRR